MGGFANLRKGMLDGDMENGYVSVGNGISVEDAADELKRIEALEFARKEIERKQDMPPEQLLFSSV